MDIRRPNLRLRNILPPRKQFTWTAIPSMIPLKRGLRIIGASHFQNMTMHARRKKSLEAMHPGENNPNHYNFFSFHLWFRITTLYETNYFLKNRCIIYRCLRPFSRDFPAGTNDYFFPSGTSTVTYTRIFLSLKIIVIRKIPTLMINQVNNATAPMKNAEP